MNTDGPKPFIVELADGRSTIIPLSSGSFSELAQALSRFPISSSGAELPLPEFTWVGTEIIRRSLIRRIAPVPPSPPVPEVVDPTWQPDWHQIDDETA